MSSIYEEIIKRLDTLATDIAALTINEGAGAAGGSLSGSGTTNRIAQWTGASSLGDSTLIKTGAGVLTLAAGADYTLTVPATGTAALGTGGATQIGVWADANTLSSSANLTHVSGLNSTLTVTGQNSKVYINGTQPDPNYSQLIFQRAGVDWVGLTADYNGGRPLFKIGLADVGIGTTQLWFANSENGTGGYPGHVYTPSEYTRLHLNGIHTNISDALLAVGGRAWFSGIIESSLATGTAPFVIASTTLNTNLNADLLDGQHASDFAAASAAVTGSGTTNRIAQWTGTSSLGDSTLIKSGAGVLTISAAADYTLTVPATGTVPLGTGAANQITYWSGTNTQTGSANLTVDAAASKIILGADANLYRQAADMLWTDDSVTIDRGLVVNESGGNYSFRVESDVNANAINMTGATGVIGFGIAANAAVHIWQSYNQTNTGTNVTYYGQLADYTFTPATAPTGYTAYGAFYGATIASAHNITSAYGGRFNLTASTGITITNGIGGEFRLISAPATGITTTLTNVSIGRFSFAKSGVGATAYTTLKVVDIEAPILSAGTLSGTTAYGLYVGSLTSYGATNPYAIYTNNGIVHLNAGGATDGDLIVSSDTENMIVSDASADTIYLGGQTNGISITKGGDLTLLGTATVYDDFVVMLANVKAPASDPPTWRAYKGTEVPAFGAANTNILYFTVQLPYRWKDGGVIEPHFHAAYPNANTGNSRWTLTYSWANIDGTFPTETSVSATFAAPGVADAHKLHSFGTISPTGKTGSSVLLCSLARIGGNAADTYASDIYATSADFHIEIDKMGAFAAP